MKTAKKIFSLLLVAVLMLSALPFQASATTDPVSKAIFYNKDASAKLCSDVILTDGKISASAIPAAPAIEGYTFSGWQIGSAGPKVTNLAEQNLNPYLTEKKDGETILFKYVYITPAYTQNHVHTMSDPVTVAADCEHAGSITKTCTDSNCPVLNYKEVETITALGHDFGAWFEVTAAQVGVAGVEKRECQREGCDEFETRNTDPLEAPPAPTYEVKFYGEDGTLVATKYWPMYHVVASTDLPDAAELLNKDFMGWYTSPTGGTKLEAGDRWDNYYNNYYARYEDSVHDGQSKINVYFRLYSEGVAQGQARKLTSFQVADYTSLASALNAKKSQFADMLAGYVDLGMYEITDGYYVYDPSTGKEAAMDSNAKVNGDNSVLIKLVANKSARATVMVFVHSKVEAAAAYTYTMAGYTTNDTVFETDVENLLKSKGKNYTVNGMFSDNMWERKLAGYTTDPVSTLSIEDDGLNGVLKIHVLAPNFSAGTSKPADKTNPATGDTAMIEITAAVMLLSAAAVVTLTQLRKRKMI